MDYTVIGEIVTFVEKNTFPADREFWVRCDSADSIDINHAKVIVLSGAPGLLRISCFKSIQYLLARDLAYICVISYRRYFRNEPVFLDQQVLDARSRSGHTWITWDKVAIRDIPDMIHFEWEVK